MPHFARALAAMILLGIGFTLSELQPLAGTRQIPASSSQTRTPQAVIDFYAGINQFLAGGPENQLLESIHPRFSLEDGSRPELAVLRDLAMVRSVYPDLHLAFETLSVAGDTVNVLVSATSPSGGHLAGSQVEYPGEDPVLERLTIRDGRIVEWQRSRHFFARLANILDLPRPFDVRAGSTLALELRTFAAGALLAVPVNRGVIVLVESGQLDVRFPSEATSVTIARGAASGGIASRVNPGAQDLRLAAGDMVAIPTRTPFTVANAGESPATAAWIEMRTQTPASLAGRPGWERPASDLPAGITSQTLVNAGNMPSGREITSVAVALSILEPGSELPASLQAGPALLMVSDGEIQTGATDAIMRTADRRLARQSGPLHLEAGQALGLPGGAHHGYRSIGPIPAVVWIINTTSRPI